MHASVLATPVYDRAFKLAIDASDAGAGAVVLHDGPDAVEHPVFQSAPNEMGVVCPSF